MARRDALARQLTKLTVGPMARRDALARQLTKLTVGATARRDAFICMILNMDKSLTLVAAVAKNRAIGLRGRMPWRLPDELQHFKRVTLGKPVVMGRKTWEAIGRPLPGRQNIVVSRNRAYRPKGCELAISLDAALSMADGAELMIIGGGELYRLALPYAQRMVLTIVDCAPEADTWFPGWSESAWELASSEHHPADDRHAFSFDMQEWIRVSAHRAPGKVSGPPA